MIHKPSTIFAERLGLIVGIALVGNLSFMTVAPYVLEVTANSQRLIDQQQTILQSVFMVLVGYLWGNSAGNKAKDSALSTSLDIAKTATQANNPTPSIPVSVGETVTVKGEQ